MDYNAQSQDRSPFPAQPERSSGNVGPLAAAVIIVVLLAAGGFYFFYTQQERIEEQAPEPRWAEQEGDARGGSIDVLESELEATQTTGAEADLSELEGAL